MIRRVFKNFARAFTFATALFAVGVAAFSAIAQAQAQAQTQTQTSDTRLWQKLDALSPGLSSEIQSLHALFCAARPLGRAGATEPDAPSAREEKLRNALATAAGDLSLSHLELGDGSYWAVLESVPKMRRVIFQDSGTRAKLQLHDVLEPRRWKKLELAIETQSCKPNYFSFSEQGRMDVTSFSPANRFESWSLGPPRESRLSPRPAVVAVIDSGFDLRHPLLAPYLLRDGAGAPITLNARDFVAAPEPDDHGNHVAGIVSRESPEIAVLPVMRPNDNVLGQGPSSAHFIPATDLSRKLREQLRELQLETVDFAILNGARVLNMSFGGRYRTRANQSWTAVPGSFDGYEDAFHRYPEAAFVVAAGNDGQDIDEGSWHPVSERRKNVAVVAAVDARGRLASFSNYGKELVDFAAEGVDIASYDSGADGGRWRPDLLMSGTSMAAPQVSRLIGRMLALRPELSAEDTIGILCATVTPSWELLRKTRCGGIVNGQAALEAVARPGWR
ncbi:MAG: S8 family serine peptidase [Oligoflexia bacterium]|nr:S8 family serine peptidase [Oligoflexia bacterium]